MPELRWILLALGAVLIAALWWWELRRARPPSRDADRVELPPAPAAERTEPTLGVEDAVESRRDFDVPTMRASADERSAAAIDPPVLTIKDLPEDTDRVVLASSAPAPRRMEPMYARREQPASAAGSSARTAAPPPVSVAADAGSRPGAPPPRVPGPEFDDAPETVPPRAPSVARPAVAAAAPVPSAAPIAPSTPITATATVGATSASGSSSASATSGLEARRPAARLPGRAAAPGERFGEPKAPAPEPASPQQRIVAIRLVLASGERVDGAQLRGALEGQGLRHGKYSIFHRQRADGRALYSVASLLEPGSFDLARMDGERFPGVSLFAVFPGPIDAPDVFDDLLSTARQLAERLDGVLQDERGAPLTVQRALGLREELVAFQALVTRLRGRPTG